jgi:heat shock protein HslJ
MAGVMLAACGTDNGRGAAGGAADLERAKWVLAVYGEVDSPIAVLPGSEMTAVFEGGEGQLSGSAGCNTYFATYAVDGNRLTISDMAFTEMYCADPEGVMDQEQQFLQALSGAETYEIQDGQLRIRYSGGGVLVFQAR